MGKQIFIDFDGTVTTRDTVVAMTENFGAEGWQDLNLMWEKKQISTEECARRTLALFKANLDDLDQILNTIKIDEYFTDFLQLCTRRGYPVHILSDGYDYNIKSILARHKITIPFYSNKLLYSDHFDIACPFTNQDCGNCGTCKTKLMEQLRKPGQQAVYIGDGFSDTCPARHADQVFAKGSLLKFCRENGVKATAFINFRDIITCLQKD